MPSFGDVVFITIFSLAIALGANLTHRDGDLAKHLRLGGEIIDQGRLPVVDTYSHTMTGGEMVPHEWLAQSSLAATERWFGFDGIGVLAAVLAALPWFIMYRWLIKRGTAVGLSVALCLLGAAASMIHWAARPHAFTWIFVVIWVILLEDLRRGERDQVWILIPLAVLWVNTHGGFIVGFYLLGTYLAGAVIDRYRGHAEGVAGRARHLLQVLLATIAASFVNPTGYKLVIHPFAHLLGDDFLFDFTTEFNSPDFHSLFFWPFLAMIVFSVLLSFHWNPTTLLLAASSTAFGLYALRNIPLYALIITPILAEAVMSARPETRSSRFTERLREYSAIEKNLAGGSLSVILIAATVLMLARAPGSGFSFGSPFFPVEAVEQVGEAPPGDHVFNQFVWGGYLVYCCHPQLPVFIDGQTDYYGPELTSEYDQTIRGLPAWRDVFEAYGIDWALISPNSGLAGVLVESGDWEERYRDESSVIFVRGP